MEHVCLRPQQCRTDPHPCVELLKSNSTGLSIFVGRQNIFEKFVSFKIFILKMVHWLLPVLALDPANIQARFTQKWPPSFLRQTGDYADFSFHQLRLQTTRMLYPGSLD